MSSVKRVTFNDVQEVPVESAIEDAKNPLLNRVFLKGMFKYLNWFDLKSCRLVCKTWHADSEECWLQEAPEFNLYSKGEGAGKYEDRKNKSRIHLQQLLEKPEIANYPYLWAGVSKYKNFTVLDYNSIADCWAIDHEFWLVSGEWMTRLVLCNCKINSTKDLRKLFSCALTPKLKDLDLHHCIFSSAFDKKDDTEEQTTRAAVKHMERLTICYAENSERLPITWKELIGYYPCLKALELEAFEKHINMMDLGNVSKSMKSITDSSSMSSRRSNNIKIFPYPVLTVLHLGLTQPEDIPFIYDILESQNDVKSLTLNGIARISSINIPVLPKLTRLRLFNFAMDSMSFLTSCPRLKELEMITYDPHFYFNGNETTNFFRNENNNRWIRARIDALRLPSMRKFICNYVIKYSPVDMARMYLWTPNLAHIRMHMNNLTFRSVCRNFPQLETLYVYCSLIDDEGIVGFSLPDRGFWTPTRRYHNITDLKVLVKLAILGCDHSYKRYCGSTPVALTEVSCRLGFLQLPSLRMLHVSSSAITAQGHNILEVEFPGYDSEPYLAEWY